MWKRAQFERKAIYLCNLYSALLFSTVLLLLLFLNLIFHLVLYRLLPPCQVKPGDLFL